MPATLPVHFPVASPVGWAALVSTPDRLVAAVTCVLAVAFVAALVGDDRRGEVVGVVQEVFAAEHAATGTYAGMTTARLRRQLAGWDVRVRVEWADADRFAVKVRPRWGSRELFLVTVVGLALQV